MINLKTYKETTKLFNKYLSNKNTNIYTLSNPLLSIINEHPRHTKLLNTKIVNNSFIIFLKFYFFTLPALVLFFLIKKFLTKKIKININSKTLIFSHLIDTKYLNKNEDYIFGKIFQRKSKNVSFVYLSALKSHKKINSQIKKNRFSKNYILMDNDYKYVNINDLFKIIFNCLIERKKLINEARRKINIKEKNLLLLAANFSFSSSSIINLIRYFTILNIINNIKPKNIITTFEGHPLEKLIFYASYKVDPKIRKIAYQNTFILKNQNSMFMQLKKYYLPNEIWLSGKIYYSKFKNIFSKKIKIKIFGSSRKFSLSKKKNKIKPNNNICLVIPEGFYSSTSDLMKFCINFSKKYSNIKKFILRIHPELNVNILFKKYPELADFKKFNIEISKNFDPKKDFIKCNLCLYRQTTLVSQAILFGLKPFYLVDKGNINVDSIFLLKSWKEYIYSSEDLMLKVKKFNLKKNKFKDLQKAKNLCKKFYTNVDYKLINTL